MRFDRAIVAAGLLLAGCSSDLSRSAVPAAAAAPAGGPAEVIVLLKPPENVAAVTMGSGTDILVTWSDTNTLEEGYRVDLGGSPDLHDARRAAVVPAGGTSYIYRTSPGLTYYFRVLAVTGEWESDPSAIVSASTFGAPVASVGGAKVKPFVSMTASGGFSTDVVVAGAGSDGTSIALEAVGILRVAEYDAALRYVSNAEGSFAARPVLQVSPVDGSVQIVYVDAPEGPRRLKRAVFWGGRWSFEFVTGPEMSVGDFSFVLDAAGRPHLAYRRSGAAGYELVYGQDLGAGWIFMTVPTGGSPGDNAIAVDPSGDPHILFFDGVLDARGLYHAARVGGAWTVEPVDVDPLADRGAFVSVAIAGAGRIHAAYYDAAAGDLRHAWKDPGGAWTRRLVDHEGNVGTHASIALDASGRVHIAYRDETNRTLKLAREK